MYKIKLNNVFINACNNKAFDFMSLYNTTAFKQSSFSNFRMPFKFQLFSPASGDSNLIVSSGSLDDGMIGQTVIINDPQVDTTSPNLPTSYTVPSQYSSSVIDITNDSTLNLVWGLIEPGTAKT